MIAVLDTSAALELVLSRKKAASIAKVIRKVEFVISPDLYSSEVLNVLWRYVRYENLALEDAEALLDRALMLPDHLDRVADMAAEVFALACQSKLSAYDAAYLTLARRNNAALLSLDKKLNKVAKDFRVRVLA